MILLIFNDFFEVVQKLDKRLKDREVILVSYRDERLKEKRIKLISEVLNQDTALSPSKEMEDNSTCKQSIQKFKFKIYITCKQRRSLGQRAEK